MSRCSRSTPPRPRFPRERLATLSATDCVDRIRTGPIAEGAEVPIKQGNLLCLVTSASRAVTEGISRKVVALEVVGVVDEQGTSTATVNGDHLEHPSLTGVSRRARRSAETMAGEPDRTREETTHRDPYP